MFNTLLIYLQKNTEVGFFASAIAFFISLAKSSMPLIQWVSAIIFLLIGIFTLLEKIRGIKKKS